MKAVRIISLVLAVLMMGMVLVSCGGDNSESTDTKPTDIKKHDPINVNIIVRESENGENKYASDENTGYDYVGDATTPLAILEEFMDFTYDITITYDDNGNLAKVGDLEATGGHLWLWSLAKAPKTASMATRMDANLDDYTDIKNGDTIVIYLS